MRTHFSNITFIVLLSHPDTIELLADRIHIVLPINNEIIKSIKAFVAMSTIINFYIHCSVSGLRMHKIEALSE